MGHVNYYSGQLNHKPNWPYPNLSFIEIIYQIRITDRTSTVFSWSAAVAIRALAVALRTFSVCIETETLKPQMKQQKDIFLGVLSAWTGRLCQVPGYQSRQVLQNA